MYPSIRYPDELQFFSTHDIKPFVFQLNFYLRRKQYQNWSLPKILFFDKKCNQSNITLTKKTNEQINGELERNTI